MNGAAVCPARSQVAAAIVADLRGVETGSKPDDLRPPLWGWRRGTLSMAQRGIGGLIGEALNQVDGFLRNGSENCLPAIPHHGAEKLQICRGQRTAVERRCNRGRLGAIVGIPNANDAEFGISWNSY